MLGNFSTKSHYAWKSQLAKPATVLSDEAALSAVLRQTCKELARVTEERDIKKRRPCADRQVKGTFGERELRARIPVNYAFIWTHGMQFSVRSICRVLKEHFSGFYTWLKELCGCKMGNQKLGEAYIGWVENHGVK